MSSIGCVNRYNFMFIEKDFAGRVCIFSCCEYPWIMSTLGTEKDSADIKLISILFHFLYVYCLKVYIYIHILAKAQFKIIVKCLYILVSLAYFSSYNSQNSKFVSSSYTCIFFCTVLNNSWNIQISNNQQYSILQNKLTHVFIFTARRTT